MKDGLARMGKVIGHAIDKFIGIILETRKNYNQTVFLFSASGDDSPPCKNDKVIIIKIDGTGNFIGAGVLVKSQGAKPGEKIFYGRDAGGGVVSKLSMLNDGSVILDGEKTVLNGGGKKSARKGDRVKVTIPAGTFITSVTGQATGTLNGAPVEVEGEITEGSESVEVGD
jgi:uncharacterized Zn-binding protein involved in type VI secretion